VNVIDPGHRYALDPLDGPLYQELIFVKREGDLYPGNVGHHPGTTTQEVLRALIERSAYVNAQTPCAETACVVQLLTACIVLLELRAARRHGRALGATVQDLVGGASKCGLCGHVGCPGHPAHPSRKEEPRG
jgi:hypothetical protein